LPEFNQPLLINILGHAGGALIFAIFLCLLYSGRGWSGVRGRYLSGVAAGLSLAWNLGSLAVLALPNLPPRVLAVVVALSFSWLSLLPAVLLHHSVGAGFRPLVVSGYGLSAVAVAMHFWEIGGNGATLHQTALMLITIGFLLLTLAVVLLPVIRGDGKHQPGGTRVLAAMCLALFASSFVHFGTGHAGQAWSSELVLHHAGIPLALFVLLQDYRFILLDAFVRFLANALLAALLTVVVIGAAFRLVLVDQIARDPLKEALLLISVCLFLVVFAWLRNALQTLLTRAVFRQGSVAELPARVRNHPDFAGEEQYLDWAAAAVGAAFNTRNYAAISENELESGGELRAPVLSGGIAGLDALPHLSWAEVLAPVRLGAGNSKLIVLGRRQGGQRYLGEDLDALARTATEIAEQVEKLRQQEMHRLVNQAELRALQSQMNPHFLFNALNTLYGTIPREATEARRIVLNLADLFRYVLRSSKTVVPLAEELQIVRAYLEVEQLRLGERLHVEIQMDESALNVPIPVLSVQPLVENAIKHGVANRRERGHLRIQAGVRSNELHIFVENSGADGAPDTKGSGIALANVRRRLEICYGSAATLDLVFTGDTATAEITIPAVAAVASP
jgi:two-component system LytT family sensor kinase